MERMQHVSLSGERGGPSAQQMVESRMLYVRAKEGMQNVSRSGRPYPNIMHNVQSPALKQTRLPYIKISRICRHSRQSVVSNPSACRMVESRIHYVKQKEWQECDTPCFFIKRRYAVSTPGKSPRDFRGGCCTVKRRLYNIM